MRTSRILIACSLFVWSTFTQANIFTRTAKSMREEAFEDVRLRAIGLFMVPHGERYRYCTAFLVPSGDRRTYSDVIVTSSHCFHEVDSETTYPGLDKSSFRTYSGIEAAILPSTLAMYTWTPLNEVSKDFAFVKVMRRFPVGDFPPVNLKSMTEVRANQLYKTTGFFVASGDQRDRKFFTSSCSASYIPDKTYGGFLNDCSITHGASGSPFYEVAAKHLDAYGINAGNKNDSGIAPLEYEMNLANMCIDGGVVRETLDEYLASLRYLSSGQRI